MAPLFLKKLLRAIAPYGLVSAHDAKRLRQSQAHGLATFYRDVVASGELVFDVGANVGNRVAPLRLLGAHVIAIEPQEGCCELLRRTFGADRQVSIVQKAVGAEPSVMTLYSGGDRSVVATLSRDFIASVQRTGRFGQQTWNDHTEVNVTTLDALIQEFGEPAFIKIDVEGFEPQVMAGLSRPVRHLSFEWTPELTANATQCLERIGALGNYEFNFTWGESMRFAFSRWVTRAELENLLRVAGEDPCLFGDIFARSVMRV